MTIPFLDFFKKFTARRAETADETPVETPARVVPNKPSSERLSKTVMPNTTRSTSTDFFKTAGDSAPNVRAVGNRALPPTVALALQPKVERAISLPLSDVIDRVPVGFLKPLESFDATQLILLKASEIEQGMSDGKPAVSLFSIYEQVPDIFVRNVRPDDSTQVAVPHAHVLEQLRKMQVRDDQEVESAVPQVETPILKVTIEDTERFGTKLAAITTSAHPPVKVEPATAKAFSSAEPEPAVREKVVTTAGQVPAMSLASPPKISPPSTPDPVAPARIPFKLPPKGTDETALERVPASSSSSVPLSVPTVAPSTRIPFKMTPPSDDLKPKLQIVPGVAAEDARKVAEPAAAVPASNAKISLSLRAVAQNMPSFQLHRPADTFAADVRFELPLSLVESQLATGRVAVPIKTFRNALPEEYKSIVVIDAGESPVLLPLQEVLKNLSPNLLKMRDDQVVDEVAESFETPFSIKAAEDARRFTEEVESAQKVTETPAEAKPEQTALAPVEPKSVEPKSVAPESAEKAAEVQPPALKLPKLEPAAKPIAPSVAETKSAPALEPLGGAKAATELKPTVPMPAATALKPEAPTAATSPAAPKINLETKAPATMAPVASVVAPPPVPAIPAMKVAPAEAKPVLKLPSLNKPQPPVTVAPPTTSSQPAPLPKIEVPVPTVTPLPNKIPVALKSDATADKPLPSVPAPAPAPAPTVKIPAKPEMPAAVKLMPTALAAAVAEPSQPLMQTMPVPSQVVAPAAVAAKQAVPAAPAPANAPESKTPEKFFQKPAQKAAEVNMNAKAVMEEVAKLAGISAATVVFEDGLALAGNLPDDVPAGGLCAIAPSILQKINRHTAGTKFGALVSMTLDWPTAQLSFFMAGAVCVAVLHNQPVLPGETHRRLADLTKELSRTYAQPGDKHVDH